MAGNLEQRLLPFPNWLFVECVQALETEAFAQGSMKVYSYRKALNSLLKYPLPIADPKVCLDLEGIGPHTVLAFTERLHAHLEAGGSKDPKEVTVKKTIKSANSPQKSIGAQNEDPNRKKPRRAEKKYVPKYRSGAYAILVALLQLEANPHFPGYANKEDLIAVAQPHCSSSLTIADPGTYYNAWASMSTLNDKGWVSKRGNPARYSLTDIGRAEARELWRAAQKYTQGTHDGASLSDDADSDNDVGINSPKKKAAAAITPPFPIPPAFPAAKPPAVPAAKPPAVPKPPKAAKVKAQTPAPLPPVPAAPLPTTHAAPMTYTPPTYTAPIYTAPTTYTIPTTHTVAKLPAIPTPVAAPPAVPLALPVPQANASDFIFEYLTSEGRPSILKDEAEVDFEGDQVIFKIRYPLRLSSHPMAEKLVRKFPNHNGRFQIAFMIDTYATEQSPGLLANLESPPRTLTAASSSSSSLSSSFSSSASFASTPQVSRTASTASLQRLPSASDDSLVRKRSVASQLDEGEAASSSTDKRSKARSGYQRSDSIESTSSSSTSWFVPKPLTVSALPPATWPKALCTLKQHDTQISDQDANIWIEEMQTFDLEPGTYDVVLIVDNREKRGKRDVDGYFEQNLLRQGVLTEIRPLVVGDMLWVARPRGLSPLEAAQKEVVLGFVVERKRMDDLSASIKDGRFREQRFRLASCNADHVIYMVEDISGPLCVYGWDPATLNTAMWHLQLWYQCFVKCTNNSDESIEYLVSMTHRLSQMFRTSSLRTISWVSDGVGPRELRELREKLAVRVGRPFYVTYQLFDALNDKSKNLTLRDLFIKQLLTVQKAGQDIVTAIVAIYPTCQSLVNAFAALPDEQSKKLMLADITYGKVKKRKIGHVVSQNVYQVFAAVDHSVAPADRGSEPSQGSSMTQPSQNSQLMTDDDA